MDIEKIMNVIRTLDYDNIDEVVIPVEDLLTLKKEIEFRGENLKKAMSDLETFKAGFKEEREKNANLSLAMALKMKKPVAFRGYS